MTEETKKQLMQHLQRLAAHYDIPNAELVTFKKRSVLLELLSTKNEEAFKLVSQIIEKAMTLDRIQNDTEKQARKPDHWNLEVANMQELKTNAEEVLIQFFKKERIS